VHQFQGFDMRRSSREDHGQSGLLQQYVRTAGSGISRSRAQRTLGAARIEAELANRAKTDFLANMSHELRTPLNAIIGFADMIIHTPVSASDPERTVEYGNHIATAGRHLLSMLSDILDMAQIDGGNYGVDIAPCDARRALELSVACVKERMNAKHQLVSVLIDNDLPPLMADYRRLQQALVNLLSNACQYTQEGGCITVRCTRRPDGGVVIIISDNGRGMSEDKLRRGLAPFAHLQNAYAASDEPMSLGLAISKRLVELQRGSFAIYSQPGEGTQVEIHFSAAALAERKGSREGDAA
jgi:two-component system cell cycle sensor histidine kinase PleC